MISPKLSEEIYDKNNGKNTDKQIYVFGIFCCWIFGVVFQGFTSNNYLALFFCYAYSHFLRRPKGHFYDYFAYSIFHLGDSARFRLYILWNCHWTWRDWGFILSHQTNFHQKDARHKRENVLGFCLHNNCLHAWWKHLSLQYYAKI